MLENNFKKLLTEYKFNEDPDSYNTLQINYIKDNILTYGDHPNNKLNIGLFFNLKTHMMIYYYNKIKKVKVESNLDNLITQLHFITIDFVYV